MSVSSSTVKLRADAVELFQAGVAAADPFQAVERGVRHEHGQLHVRLSPLEKPVWHSESWHKVHVVAFGKAACAMAEAAVQTIPANLLGRALAVTNYENVRKVEAVEVLGAGHPLPDAAGLTAAQRVAEMAASVQEQELLLVLISGGGSALLPYPVENLTLEEKVQTTRLLLASGATINEINCIRKHLSRLKGGGLARLAFPAAVHALILSDVIGDDLSSIASGPTVPDPTCFADAIQILEAKQLWQKIPAATRDYLEQGLAGNAPETPKPHDPIFKTAKYTLIGSNTVSLEAVMAKAQDLNYVTQVYSSGLSGEVSQVAADLAAFVKQQRPGADKRPIAILAGGETTVNVTGTGLGGRNQQMALAFAAAAEQIALSPGWVFLSAGTDGRDGPTDAAGGIVDSGTLGRIANTGRNPQEYLTNNDAYHALEAAEDLLKTGATGTNVADLQIVLLNSL